MAEETDEQSTTFKDKLKDVGKKVSSASKKAAQKTSEVSKKAAQKTSEVSKKAASDIKTGAQKFGETVGKKRVELKEKRMEALDEKIEKKQSKIKVKEENEKEIQSEIEETVDEEEKVTITKSEYNKLIEDAKSKSHPQSSQTIESETRQESTEKNKQTFGGEISQTISDIKSTITMTVLFAGILFGTEIYLQSNPQQIGNISAELLIWPVGTGLWSFLVLNILSKSKTILSMSFPMRVQTSIGIGLGTEIILILASESVAITQIWGWTAAVALTAILLSGLFRAITSPISRRIRRK